MWDDWKRSPERLNLGVRYEYATPQWEASNHLANFVPGSPLMISSLGIPNRAGAMGRSNWAPRIGTSARSRRRP